MKKLLIIAAVATFFFSCKEEKKENIITVGVMDVEYNDTSYSRSYPGLVSTSQYKVLLSFNGGTVESVNVRTGKKVTSGTVIAQVHSPNVVSMYNANKAQLHQAEESYKRAGKVYEGGGISEILHLSHNVLLELYLAIHVGGIRPHGGHVGVVEAIQGASTNGSGCGIVVWISILLLTIKECGNPYSVAAITSTIHITITAH